MLRRAGGGGYRALLLCRCRAFWVRLMEAHCRPQREGPGAGKQPGGPCGRAICRIELQPDTPGTSCQPLTLGTWTRRANQVAQAPILNHSVLVLMTVQAGASKTEPNVHVTPTKAEGIV